jgi:hypothetical protein
MKSSPADSAKLHDCAVKGAIFVVERREETDLFS